MKFRTRPAVKFGHALTWTVKADDEIIGKVVHRASHRWAGEANDGMRFVGTSRREVSQRLCIHFLAA